MKKLTLFAFVAAILSVVACSKQPEPVAPKSTDVSIKGIVAYSLSKDRGSDDLIAEKDESSKVITLTTTALSERETPVDLKNVIVELTLAKGATSDIKSSYDLESTTAKVVITAEDGTTTATWTLKAVRTDPYPVIPTITAVATPVWQKTAEDLQVHFPHWGSRGMACWAEDGESYLYILDNQLAYSDDNQIKVYDASTGTFIQNFEIYEGGWKGVRSYTWALDCDEAGNVAITRMNADQAGFWLDLYTGPSENWTYVGSPLQYPQSQEGLTYYAGKKMHLLGNLRTGEGRVIATCGHFYGIVLIQAAYDIHTFIDGTPSPSITPMTYPGEWHAGEVQQESLTDPTLYVTMVNEANFPNDEEETWPDCHASHFEIYNAESGDRVAIDESCFNYRILASKVFRVGQGRFLYTLEQTYSPIGPYIERLYNITDEKFIAGVNKDSEDFSKFLLWQSEPDDCGLQPGGIDYRFGSVAVLPETSGNSAVLFSYHAADDFSLAKVTSTRVVFTETYDD